MTSKRNRRVARPSSAWAGPFCGECIVTVGKFIQRKQPKIQKPRWSGGGGPTLKSIPTPEGDPFKLRLGGAFLRPGAPLLALFEKWLLRAMTVEGGWPIQARFWLEWGSPSPMLKYAHGGWPSRSATPISFGHIISCHGYSRICSDKHLDFDSLFRCHRCRRFKRNH